MKRVVPVLIAFVVGILALLLGQADTNFLFLAGLGTGAGIVMVITQ